jgi:hypothetical protein
MPFGSIFDDEVELFELLGALLLLEHAVTASATTTTSALTPLAFRLIFMC